MSARLENRFTSNVSFSRPIKALWAGLLSLLAMSVAVWALLETRPVASVVPVSLSWNHYEAIEIGMSLEQVKRIIGCEPSEIVPPGNRHLNSGYYWKDVQNQTLHIGAPHGKVETYSFAGQ